MGVIVIATKLRDCTVLYMDGTFKSCTRPYTQFLTIHGLFHGRCLSLVMALMTERTIAAYRQIFKQAKAKVRRLTGHRLRPRRIVMDFVVSLITATETEFRGATISGCYFHFCQSLWRRIRYVGLAAAYRKVRSLKKFLRLIMAIGYLPVALVRLNFQELVSRDSSQRQIGRYPALRDFMRNMELNYVNPDVTFPIRMWNVYEREQRHSDQQSR
ncbi:Hypp6187 [Branchiostoma lanceolatum]|uniref:Hypp6187 protein n=1 Tax=Branchiostoma lanceolatum TaxID=7740 RepID=A0A8J9VK18_BRALA|nr:Hypp6187 [Branchiostoma lanceolatum]